MANLFLQPGVFLVFPPVGLVRFEGNRKEGDVTFYRLTSLLGVGQPTISINAALVSKSGLRPLSNKKTLRETLAILRTRKDHVFSIANQRKASCKEAWCARINSGDLCELACVVRDLTREEDEKGRSLAEKEIYDTALLRLSSEIGAIFKTPANRVKEKLLRLMRLPPNGFAKPSSFPVDQIKRGSTAPDTLGTTRSLSRFSHYVGKKCYLAQKRFFG